MPVNRPASTSGPGQAFAGTRAGGERGFIIVAVLWIMTALATLAAIYATYVVRTAYAVGPSDDRVNAEALFTAALELTAYRLNVGGKDSGAKDAGAKEGRPSHGRLNFRLGRATVVEEFHSESGRIDLNAAQKPLLANLFVMLGAKPEDADQFADRIIGWRTAAPKNGAPDPEADAYRVAGRNYKPRGAPFQEVGELWLVLGLPPAWVERVMPYVTVYGGGAQVNILDAQPLVLAALGIAPEQVNAVLAQRDQPGVDGKALMQALGDVQGATVEPGKAMRVSVVIQFDSGVRSTAEIVILLDDDGDEPYRVLSWRDDFDQIAPAGG
jgi:general secretion pathway protein K